MFVKLKHLPLALYKFVYLLTYSQNHFGPYGDIDHHKIQPPSLGHVTFGFIIII